MPYNWGMPQAPTPQWGLAGQTNQFMAGQAPLSLRQNLPRYGQNIAQRATNTSSWLQGRVPDDVVGQIQQTGAERGGAIGSPGSPNANAAWLRALGLTSLGLQQQGSQQLSQEIADTPQPSLWNPMSLYVPQVTAHQELQAARTPPPSANPWGPSQNSTVYTNFMGLGGGEWMRR